MSFKILVLEDNTLLLNTLDDFLSDNGCECTLVKSGKEALKRSYEEKFDLYLLDVKVPDIDGFEFLKELRQTGDRTPAIFITSLNDQESVTQGFMLGGDDYIKKPFDLNEVLLRIKAILARTKGTVDEVIEFNHGYELNITRKRLLYKKVEVDLHLKDFDLLTLLIQERGRVVTKEMIYDHLWARSEECNEGSIRVYINNLKKIFGKDSITNLRGIGYRFETE